MGRIFLYGKKRRKRYRKKLKEYIKDNPCEEGDDLPGDIVTKIKNLQDDLRSVLVKSEKSKINALTMAPQKGKKAI
jgi:hypothetical protein